MLPPSWVGSTWELISAPLPPGSWSNVCVLGEKPVEPVVYGLDWSEYDWEQFEMRALMGRDDAEGWDARLGMG